MSSFTISKSEYVKAAGIVAGIASVKRDFFIYDYEKGRRMTEADLYDKFVECYTMNALSVQEQYGDSEPDTDPDDYMSVFKAAKQRGTKAAIYGVKDTMIQLKDFFDSAVYQTEKDAYMWKMKIFFGAVISELFDIAFPHERESWGSLEA